MASVQSSSGSRSLVEGANTGRGGLLFEAVYAGAGDEGICTCASRSMGGTPEVLCERVENFENAIGATRGRYGKQRLCEGVKSADECLEM